MPVATRAQDVHLEKARRVLEAVPLVDGHNDLPWYIRSDFKEAPLDVEKYDLRRPTSGNTDLARLKRGMVGGQFWSVYVPGDYRDSGLRARAARADRHRAARDREVPGRAAAGVHGAGHLDRACRRPHRLAAWRRRWPRHRELARRAARVLRPGRAVHDAHAQRDARLGRRRRGFSASWWPHQVWRGGRATR